MAQKEGFTKTDMERVGLFQEMTYHTINDRYKRPGAVGFNEAAGKGKQILPGGTKMRSAQQYGYFNEKFNRVFEGEGYTDPIKRRRQHRLTEGKKNIGKPFLPSNGEKQPSGLGSHYGTLGGNVSAFSPANRAGKDYKAPGRNFTTNPLKKGTGYGYSNVTIGNYHKYQSDAYERARELQKKDIERHRSMLKGGAFRLNMHPHALFDDNPYRGDRPIARKESAGGLRDVKPFKPSSPGKNPGGMKSGTFDPYPSHSADPYKIKYPKSVNVVNKSGKTFMPSPGPKSAPVNSIVNQNVIRTINAQNYKTLQSSIMSY